MKRVMQIVMGVATVLGSLLATGQNKIDDRRMEQDIEVAENILSTLVRQQFNKRNFFPMEVSGSYMAGYGVTFRMPRGGAFNMLLFKSMDEPNTVINAPTPDGFSTTYSYSFSNKEREEDERAREKDGRAKEKTMDKAEREVIRQQQQIRTPKGMKIISDSSMATANQRFLDVAKSFLADYGDVLSQLRPEERIVITNRGEEFGGDFNFRWPGAESRRSLISVEAKRDDIAQLKQGKITRDQFLGRLKTVNTETSEKLDPDLEVLSSMFSRLYREDLSKTYYSQGEVTYERLKDFGVIYYMRVYSSIQGDDERWAMPTIAMSNVPTPERDRKVKELYPKFESELKENLIEYGRTLRSLNDHEQLVFNVKLTKCTGCGIPTSIELSVNSLVLKDYSSGKASKEASIAKVNVKKVGDQ